MADAPTYHLVNLHGSLLVQTAPGKEVNAVAVIGVWGRHHENGQAVTAHAVRNALGGNWVRVRVANPVLMLSSFAVASKQVWEGDVPEG